MTLRAFDGRESATAHRLGSLAKTGHHLIGIEFHGSMLGSAPASSWYNLGSAQSCWAGAAAIFWPAASEELT